MRFTYSQFREIARTGGTGWRPPNPNAKPTSTYGTRNKAVRLLHEQSEAAAIDYLEGRGDGKGLTGYFGPGERGARQGALTRQAFNYYAAQARRDARPWVNLFLSADVPVGPDTVNVVIDVVLHEVRGYVGRLLLWESATHCNEVLATRYAGPCVGALSQTLGTGIPVAEVEVWHLHDEIKWLIAPEDALEALDDAARGLRQAVAQLPEE